MHDPRNGIIHEILPYTLVFIIPDILILPLALLLYGYCGNTEREIKATLTLRDHIDLNESEILRVGYTGLPSEILLGKVSRFNKHRTTKNSTTTPKSRTRAHRLVRLRQYEHRNYLQDDRAAAV